MHQPRIDACVNVAYFERITLWLMMMYTEIFQSRKKINELLESFIFFYSTTSSSCWIYQRRVTVLIYYTRFVMNVCFSAFLFELHVRILHNRKASDYNDRNSTVKLSTSRNFMFHKTAHISNREVIGFHLNGC